MQNEQYSFQTNVSTNHAIIDVVINFLENITSKLYTELVVLGLIKAFDAVSHDILLHKLYHYGIKDQAHKLMQAFLKLKQNVLVNGIKSNFLTNNYGVFQDSTLGP